MAAYVYYFTNAELICMGSRDMVLQVFVRSTFLS